MPAFEDVGRDLKKHRRRQLPHWEMGGRTYFVTFRSTRGELPDGALRQVAANVLFDHGRRYHLHFGVVMPDHAHLMLEPVERVVGHWVGLAEIMKSLKGVSARRINQLLGTSGSVWQEESFDRIVRDQDEYDGMMDYMWQNPIRKGLVAPGEEYPHYIFPPAPRP